MKGFRSIFNSKKNEALEVLALDDVQDTIPYEELKEKLLSSINLKGQELEARSQCQPRRETKNHRKYAKAHGEEGSVMELATKKLENLGKAIVINKISGGSYTSSEEHSSEDSENEAEEKKDEEKEAEEKETEEKGTEEKETENSFVIEEPLTQAINEHEPLTQALPEPSAQTNEGKSSEEIPTSTQVDLPEYKEVSSVIYEEVGGNNIKETGDPKVQDKEINADNDKNSIAKKGVEDKTTDSIELSDVDKQSLARE